MLFKIVSISHGWFQVDFNRQFLLTNSDFLNCDAPALLLEAVGNLMEYGTAVQWLCWQNEPSAYILKLERKGNQLIGQVYDTDAESTELDYSGQGLADYITECVFCFEEEMNQAAKTIADEFSLYEKGNGREQYCRHWSAFPDKEYGRLHMLLSGSAYPGRPPEGKLNGYQKHFFQYLAAVQESAVRAVMEQYGNQDKESMEMIFYDLSNSIIVEMMAIIDGYSVFCRDKMDLINQKTGVGLKQNPFIELHDAVCEFIK